MNIFFTNFFILITIYICSNYITDSNGQSNKSQKEKFKEFLKKHTECKKKISEDKLQNSLTCAEDKVENFLSTIDRQDPTNVIEPDEIRLMCRSMTELARCLKPLETELDACSTTGGKALFDLLTNLCENEGAKIIDFKDGIQCLSKNNDGFFNCFDNRGGNKYNMKDPEQILETGNLCHVMSILKHCTMEVLDTCPNKKTKESFQTFVNNLEKSSIPFKECIGKGNIRLNHAYSLNQQSLLPLIISSVPFYYFLIM